MPTSSEADLPYSGSSSSAAAITKIFTELELKRVIKMTAIELQEKIAVCRRQVQALVEKNNEICRFLREAEDGSASLFEASNRWERSRSDCIDRVRMSIDRLDSASSFRESYLRKINAILGSSEAENISANYREMNREISKGVDQAEEELASNKRRIQQLEDEIRRYNLLVEAEQAREVAP